MNRREMLVMGSGIAATAITAPMQALGSRVPDDGDPVVIPNYLNAADWQAAFISSVYVDGVEVKDAFIFNVEKGWVQYRVYPRVAGKRSTFVRRGVVTYRLRQGVRNI